MWKQEKERFSYIKAFTANKQLTRAIDQIESIINEEKTAILNRIYF